MSSSFREFAEAAGFAEEAEAHRELAQSISDKAKPKSDHPMHVCVARMVVVKKLLHSVIRARRRVRKHRFWWLSGRARMYMRGLSDWGDMLMIHGDALMKQGAMFRVVMEISGDPFEEDPPSPTAQA